MVMMMAPIINPVSIAIPIAIRVSNVIIFRHRRTIRSTKNDFNDVVSGVVVFGYVLVTGAVPEGAVVVVVVMVVVAAVVVVAAIVVVGAVVVRGGFVSEVSCFIYECVERGV